MSTVTASRPGTDISHSTSPRKGVRLHELDENGRIVFEANLSWDAFTGLIGDTIDRGAYELQSHETKEQQNVNDHAEIIDRMVQLGTRNTESGKYAYYYGTFGKDEEYVRAHCNEIKEAMLARGEIKAVESERMVYPCRVLRGILRKAERRRTASKTHC